MYGSQVVRSMVTEPPLATVALRGVHVTEGCPTGMCVADTAVEKVKPKPTIVAMATHTNTHLAKKLFNVFVGQNGETAAAAWGDHIAAMSRNARRTVWAQLRDSCCKP